MVRTHVVMGKHWELIPPPMFVAYVGNYIHGKGCGRGHGIRHAKGCAQASAQVPMRVKSH